MSLSGSGSELVNEDLLSSTTGLRDIPGARQIAFTFVLCTGLARIRHVLVTRFSRVKLSLVSTAKLIKGTCETRTACVSVFHTRKSETPSSARLTAIFKGERA